MGRENRRRQRQLKSDKHEKPKHTTSTERHRSAHANEHLGLLLPAAADAGTKLTAGSAISFCDGPIKMFA